MRGSRLTIAYTVGIALLAAGCGGGGSAAKRPPPTTSAPTGATSTSTSTISATGTVAFHAYNVRLTNSPTADTAFRVIVHTFAVRVTVTLRGRLPTPNNVVRVCPAAGLAVPSAGAACQQPASGVPVAVVHGSSRPAVEIVQAGPAGPGAAGQSVTLDEVVVEYQAAERSVQLRLPPLEPPAGTNVCKDNGCNPFFELTPFQAGSFRGQATWGAASGRSTPGSASLAVETGGIAAHELSRGGRAYRVVASAEGGPGISVSGTLATAAESATALRNTGSSTIVGAQLDLTLP